MRDAGQKMAKEGSGQRRIVICSYGSQGSQRATEPRGK
jgi:hypothetical protein